RERALDRLHEVRLPLDHVRPRRRVGVLEVGHEAAGPGVEGVDHHLAVDRAGDLDAAVLEIRRRRGDLPAALPDLARPGQEVRLRAGVELGLALGAARKQPTALAVQLLVEPRNEIEGVPGQDRVAATADRRPDVRRRTQRHAYLLVVVVTL